ncbi:DsrE/DsrF/DrsH-like family protein [Caproiciproducens galactitolivorans]|uniref:FAD-dependent oxidoreductase n=1 Tax=Caproiciproducens galactitolivorans TaxID=642589 RepID=A0ABT4BRS5_9FIRM|nr:DsrE/DsrF/DrsH-like family protein [Caproiciproducens galactitolivorans]MCY1713599.1 FAD-dependent oxidoreductase [Caproiciproducens galactitolivorans]
MKVLIVGGVAGGASAAARLRRQSEDAKIILFEKGEYISYANCGLPYYIGGTIREKERLIVTTPQLLRDRFRIDVRTKSEVVKIDREKKMVTVQNHADGTTYEESYDKLILSPGAQPKRPPLPGIDSEGIFTLRTVPDTYRIDEYIRETKAKSAVVVGAGFIGVEMAENLKKRGLDVTIVEFLDQAIASLDPEMAAILHRHLRENGVRLLFGTGVQGFEKAGNLKVKLTGDKEICADLVLLSIGVAPDSRLAKDAGLELGVGGSIKVSDTLQTSDPDIYAVGDAVCVRQLVTGGDTLIPLAGPANRQGRLAGENVLGRTEKDSGVQGSSILKVFEMTAASTGMNEKQLKAQKIPYQKTYIHPADHATYYPDSSQMSMKLLFAPDGKILGAQAVGFDGVDKRMDVLATALRLGGTVYDLEKLELCYAPPYSSAKDPVNMLGFTAANILRGDVKVFHFDEVDALDREKISLVDVRTPVEMQMGTIEGAIGIPLDVLRDRMQELPKEKPVYLFCQVGLRGYVAARILMQNGYDVKNLSGGYKTYITAKGDREQPTGTDCIGCKKEAAEPVKSACCQDVKMIEVDACGLQCPGPIMKVSEGIKSIRDGECLQVRATDPAFASDIRVWCERTGNLLLGVEREGNAYLVKIQKGAVAPAIPAQSGNDKSMIVFSGDLDKAIAALIIANGAASMGRKVTMFFTFWGLNILRKNERVSVKKNFIEKMFGRMMPRGSEKLGLSRMNMLGMGPKMIRSVMKSKNVTSLEDLLRSAIDSGVRIVACQMSMDIMGIKPEELIDGVEIAGVATFLGSAEQSDTNLFI